VNVDTTQDTTATVTCEHCGPVQIRYRTIATRTDDGYQLRFTEPTPTQAAVIHQRQHN
jgi:hypothetical protein